MLRASLALSLSLLGTRVVAEITGIKTVPGGTNGQLEYNSNGLFKGVAGSSVSGQDLSITGNFAAANFVVGGSTLSAASLAAIGVSTKALNINISTETAARISQDNTIGASTQTLKNTLPGTGSCSLPNLVSALNANAAPTCTQPSSVTGNSATATALAAAGTLAASGDLCRGVDASGNCVRSATSAATAGVSGSTLAWTSGAAYTTLTGIIGATGLGTQAQALDMGSHLINNVTTPVSANDGVNKTYVDNLAPILDYKAPVKYVAVSALPSNSYSNGSSGVGATITGLSLGSLSIDGVAPATNDRVLVNGESTASHNGIYKVTTNGAGVFFVLTRATDHDQSSEMNGGATVDVTAGVTYDSSTWVQQTDVTTVGTDAVNFYQTNGLGDVTTGTGLSKSGNTISLVTPVTVVNGGTGLASTSQNFAFIGPTSGSGAPTWRALASGDIPNNAANTSGNATSATTATNLVGGGARQIPVQTSAGVTSFTADPGNNGYVIGGGTGTITGTANQVIATQTNGNLVLSTPQSINSGAAPAFAGTNFTGTAASLTVGNVTTNANLTGDVTSVGNATTATGYQPNITRLTGLKNVTSTLTFSGAQIDWQEATSIGSMTVQGATLSSMTVTFGADYQTPVASATLSAGTYYVSFSSGDTYSYILTGAVTLKFMNGPSGLKKKTMDLRLKQDGTGSRVPTLSDCDWGAAGTPTWSTAAGKEDWVTIVSIGDAGKWYCFNDGTGFGP